MYLMPLNYAFIMVMIVNFVLCMFYHNKKIRVEE